MYTIWRAAKNRTKKKIENNNNRNRERNREMTKLNVTTLQYVQVQIRAGVAYNQSVRIIKEMTLPPVYI